MKTAGFGWIGILAGACAEGGQAAGAEAGSWFDHGPTHEGALDLRARPLEDGGEARGMTVITPDPGASGEAAGGSHAAVELYLAEDGTVIRLEGADHCQALYYACLLE
jgi:hypothetical protein